MIFSQIWNLEIKIIQLLCAILIVELPNFIRKLKRFYYIPIYFSVFPLRELNKDLSTYLAEDYFVLSGIDLSGEEIGRLKKKIIRDSAISMLISAIIIPVLSGFIFAFIFEADIIPTIIAGIILFKTYFIGKAIRDFKTHAVGSLRNISLLIIVYIFYLGVFGQLCFNSYVWTKPFIKSGNYLDLFSNISNLLFSKAIAQGVVLAALSAFFGNLITDKSIRDENIKNSE